jgi:hypothetical protein
LQLFGAGTQFTCFTPTKVQILTPEEFFFFAWQELRKAVEACARWKSIGGLSYPGSKFACFTGTKLVQKYKY